MSSTRRAARLLVTAGLVAGLGVTAAPALADGGSNVTVTVASAVPGWTVVLQCTPDGGGAVVRRQAATSSLVLVQRVVFPKVANATCGVQATQPVLVAAGLAGSASVSGVKVTKDLTVRLTPALVPVALPVTPVGTTSSATPDPTTPAPASQPQISGKPVVGHVITADAADAPAGATITGYQWYVKRVVRGHQRTVLVRIKGAHHRSLRMKERLAGKHVLVGVTYTLAGSKPTTLYSKALKVTKERMKE